MRKGTSKAYYLPAGLITGRVTEFNFGNKFKSGGYLVNLFTWTLDADGLNSYLVALSSAGDVVVYAGDDPDVPGSFREKGSYFIGTPPAGRRLAGSFGGELYLLSRFGLLPLSRLLSGALVQQTDTYLSRRIAPLVNADMAVSRSLNGWEVKLIPSERLLAIATPKRSGLSFKQYVQSIDSEGWSIYRDLPYLTGDAWLDDFYIGTDDGRVLVHSGNLDNVTLEGESDQIEWFGITAFRDYGEAGTYNRTQFIRPVFMAQQPPSYSVEARYDYNIAEVFDVPEAADPSGAVWDVAVWDVSLWAGDFQIIQDVKGASGLGRAIAVTVNGRSGSETTLIRFDVMRDGGGYL